MPRPITPSVNSFGSPSTQLSVMESPMKTALVGVVKPALARRYLHKFGQSVFARSSLALKYACIGGLDESCAKLVGGPGFSAASVACTRSSGSGIGGRHGSDTIAVAAVVSVSAGSAWTALGADISADRNANASCCFM